MNEINTRTQQHENSIFYWFTVNNTQLDILKSEEKILILTILKHVLINERRKKKKKV